MVKAKTALSSASGRSALLGSWSFLIGLVLAVLLGLGYEGAYQSTVLWVVFLLGIAVGLLNITHDEVSPFLTSGALLALVAYVGAGVLNEFSPIIGGMLKGILTLFVPATIIVALKSVFVLARK